MQAQQRQINTARMQIWISGQPVAISAITIREPIPISTNWLFARVSHMAATVKAPTRSWPMFHTCTCTFIYIYIYIFPYSISLLRWAFAWAVGVAFWSPQRTYRPCTARRPFGVEKNAYKGLIRFQYSHTHSQTHFAFRILHSASDILNSAFCILHLRTVQVLVSRYIWDIAGHCGHCFKCPNHNDCCKMGARNRKWHFQSIEWDALCRPEIKVLNASINKYSLALECLKNGQLHLSVPTKGKS